MAKEKHVQVNPGDVFGAWRVLEACGFGQKYACVCSACNKTVKNIRVYDLLKGKSLMCKSCSSRDARSEKRGTVGVSPEYSSWQHMLGRCHNETDKDYPMYGAKGITVCDLWRESFEVFLLELGPRPSLDYTLERLDYRGNYEPGNVTWKTKAEQTRNKSDNIRITIDGETKVASEWSRDSRCTVTLDTLYKRVARGMDPEEAVLKPGRKHNDKQTSD